MTKKIGLMALGMSMILLNGCGGSGGGTVSSAGGATGGIGGTATVTGQFIDTYVEGLSYTCSSGTTGVTNSGGEYTCNVGDSVEFSLGGYILGSTTASSGVVSPETLYPNNPGAALDVAQLLQTLDDDNDPSNGITIPDGYTDLDAVTVRPGDGNFDADIEAELGEPLVDEPRAQAHMDETQLRLLFTGKTFYTTIWDDIGTMESWEFNADLTSSTWTELVGGSATGAGSLVIDGMTMTFTCTFDSEQECETEPTIIEVKEVLADYVVVEVTGGELGNQPETLRLYFNEAKARAYLLDNTVDLAALNTPTEVEKNIIGIWSKGCKDEGTGSESDTLTFAADGTGSSKGAYYHTPGCNPGDEEDPWDNTFTYVIGKSTTGANGEAAVEIDHVISEDGKTINYYAMVHFTAKNKFIIGDDGDDDESNTPETRDNVFMNKDEFILNLDFETMLEGKTLYQVWYGRGVDSNGNDIDDVAVLAEVTFNTNGSAEYVGLMNEESGSGKWEVTGDKLVFVETSENFDYSEYNQYVSGDLTSGCIQTNWVNENNASDNNVDLFFTDETTAHNYANTLTSTASCP